MKNNPNSFPFKVSIIILFLLLNLVFKSSVLFLKPFEHIDAVVFPDDTYFSLNIAESIAAGKGPVCSETFTNGFQPLYVFLCVPFYKMFGDKFTPIYLSLAMLIVFDCLCLLVLMKVVNLFTSTIFPVLLITIFWITSPYVMIITLNGLETIISFFFIVTAFYYFYKHRKSLTTIPDRIYDPAGLQVHRRPQIKDLIVLGILCGLAVFARIDNGFLAAVMFIFILTGLAKKRLPGQAGAIIKSLLIFSGSVLFAVAPWLLYSYFYTGDFIQQSGEAVRYQNWSLHGYFSLFSSEQLHLIFLGFRTVLIKNFSLWILIGICCISLAVKFRKYDFGPLKEKLVLLLPVMTFCLLLFLSYVFYIYGMWFFNRYLFPLVFLLIMILAVLSDNVVKAYSDRGSRAAASISGKIFLTTLIPVLLIIHITRFDFRELFISNKTNDGYYSIGKWVSEHFKEGTVIGSIQTGAMGYFGNNVKVINLDGVVNKEALTYARNKSLIEYIKKKKIEYIINWDINQDFLTKESANLKKDDLVKLFTIRDFKIYGKEWTVYKVNY